MEKKFISYINKMKKIFNSAADVQGLAALIETTETGTMSNVQVNSINKESSVSPKAIKGKEVKLYDLEQNAESTKIDDTTFEALKFYRVTKQSGLKLLYARAGDKFYGGIRYDDSVDEEKVRLDVINMYMDGMLWDETSEIRFHESCGRKIEELDEINNSINLNL